MKTLQQAIDSSILKRTPGSSENERDNAGRTYDHQHLDIPITGAQFSDLQVGGMVRMLMRDDLSHEAIVCMARDRIFCLMKEKEKLEAELNACRKFLANTP